MGSPVYESLWLIAATLRHSALAFQTQACCSLTGGLAQIFYSELSSTHKPCWIRSSHSFSVFSASEFLVSKTTVSHLWAQACEPTSLTSLGSSFKRVSVWPPCCIASPWGVLLSMHSSSPENTVCNSQGWPPPFRACDSFR